MAKVQTVSQPLYEDLVTVLYKLDQGEDTEQVNEELRTVAQQLEEELRENVPQFRNVRERRHQELDEEVLSEPSLWDEDEGY